MEKFTCRDQITICFSRQIAQTYQTQALEQECPGFQVEFAFFLHVRISFVKQGHNSVDLVSKWGFTLVSCDDKHAPDLQNPADHNNTKRDQLLSVYSLCLRSCPISTYILLYGYCTLFRATAVSSCFGLGLVQAAVLIMVT